MRAREVGLAQIELDAADVDSLAARFEIGGVRAAGVRTLRALADQRLVRPADALLSAEQRFVLSGFPEVDALLSSSCGALAPTSSCGALAPTGGFPRGRITEVVGPPSSGCTALLLGAAATTTLGGEVAAWIDPSSALDVRAAEAAGVVLSRLLWARPRTCSVAWTAADVVLRTGGFALVVVDVGRAGLTAPARSQPAREPGAAAATLTRQNEETRVVPFLKHESEARIQTPKRRASETRVADSVWARLSRSAEQSGAALVILADHHVAGTFATVTLSMTPLGRTWRGTDATRKVLVGTLARARRTQQARPTGPRGRRGLWRAAPGHHAKIGARP